MGLQDRGLYLLLFEFERRQVSLKTLERISLLLQFSTCIFYLSFRHVSRKMQLRRYRFEFCLGLWLWLMTLAAPVLFDNGISDAGLFRLETLS